MEKERNKRGRCGEHNDVEEAQSSCCGGAERGLVVIWAQVEDKAVRG